MHYSTSFRSSTFHPFVHNSFIHQSKQHWHFIWLIVIFQLLYLSASATLASTIAATYSTHFWVSIESQLVNPFLPLQSDWHLLIHHQGRRPRHCMFQPNIKVSVQLRASALVKIFLKGPVFSITKINKSCKTLCFKKETGWKNAIEN